MSCEMTKILSFIIPGLVAIVGNIIFYMIVKSRIDKSIERHKISYAGVFQEKLEIHKKLLKHIVDLKLKIQQYQYSGDNQSGQEIKSGINDFINFYRMNQPFIKSEIFDVLVNLTKELQSCFDDFYMHNSLSNERGLDPKIKTETLKKFFDSGNKFKRNEPFKQIEDLLISEMRKDLRIDEY